MANGSQDSILLLNQSGGWRGDKVSAGDVLSLFESVTACLTIALITQLYREITSPPIPHCHGKHICVAGRISQVTSLLQIMITDKTTELLNFNATLIVSN